MYLLEAEAMEDNVGDVLNLASIYRLAHLMPDEAAGPIEEPDAMDIIMGGYNRYILNHHIDRQIYLELF